MLRRTMPNLLPINPLGGFRDAALFRPGSLALLTDPALPELSAILARNLAAGGFKGRLLFCGPAPAPEGFEAAPAAIEAWPVAPDLAVLCLPPERLEAAMAALSARGCFAAIVPGAAPDLAGMSARTGLRALGQGSFGLAVPGIGLNATLSHIPPRKGRLALVTQSAALARAVLDWAEAEAVGFSHVIGIGGNASLGFAAALDWLSRDAATAAVLLDLRRVRNRRAFVSAARAAARTRPVVAIRAGGLIGDPSGVGEAVMEAALRRAGVLTVSGLEDLLAAAETLARTRIRPGAAGPGDRVAIVTNGMGPGLLAADAVLAGGGRLAALGEGAVAGLSLLLPEGAPAPGNPFTLGPDAGPRLGEAAAMLATLPEVDAVVALHAPSASPEADEVAAGAMAAAARAGAGRTAAPVLIGWTGQATGGRQRRALAEAGLAVFASPEAAVRGALHLARDRANRAAAAELPSREVLELRPDRAMVARLLAGVRAAGRTALTEEEALGILLAYGVPTVPGRRSAAQPEDAADAAALLGFPVVLKVLCPGLAHKTEVGGVQLGLGSVEEVRAAAAAMLRRVAERRPDLSIEGFLVQRQASPGALELRLRLGEDAMFGPWIGFGQGGTAADLAGDEAFDLPPLNLALAHQLAGRARVARLLEGFRDHRAANRAAVEQALVRLSQIAVDFPELARFSVNPLLADADGVLAVDAHAALRPAGAPAAVLAIPPYPVELSRPFRTRRDGETLTVRPIRPEDAAAHAEAFRRVPAEDVRFRFFSPLKELSPGMIARLTQIDYDREMAFVAVRPPAEPGGTERILGVARLIRAPGEGAAEFAVIVGREMKGQGLGRHLMERLFDWARSQGIREILGHVLADNAPMLAFVRALGFEVRRSREEEDVMEARILL